MRRLGRLCIVGLLLQLGSLAVADNQITLSQVQLFNLGVKLGPLKQVQETPFLDAPAIVVIPPDKEYIVSAAQTGLVSKLHAAVGDEVKKGQKLADINSPELLTLQRQFLKASNQRKLALTGYKRDEKLYEEGVIATRRWLETKSSYESIVADMNEAQQLLEISGISKKAIKKLANSRRLSSVLTLEAPIDGVILERSVVAGERIDMLAPIYRLANLQNLWLEIRIPQEQMKQIRMGDQVLIVDSPATAKISLLGQQVDRQNQTVLARAIIEQSDPNIRAGQIVNTQIIQTSLETIFKVPNAAIAKRQNQNYIFQRTESGFGAIAINILGKEDDYSIISGDLNINMEIAIRGAVALKAKWIGLGEEEYK